MSEFQFRVRLPDGSPHVLYEPHPAQIAFHQSEVPNLVAIGSRGSGKSLALRMDAHMRALSVPGCALIIVRNSFPELQSSHLLFIEDEMRMIRGDNNGYHATNHIATYPNGSKLFFSHVAKSAQALNLLSAEFLAAYFDELSTIPWDYFVKIGASVRVAKSFGGQTGHKALIRAATNPLGPSAMEVLKYFVNKDVDLDEEPDYQAEDWGHIRMDMVDNPYIDQEQYKKRFSAMPTYLRRAWLEGEFAIENSLFDFYPRKEGRPYHVLPEIDLEKVLRNATVYRAIDSGWHPDPTVCIWIANVRNRNIVFHEKIWYKTTAEQVAKEIKEEDKKLGIKRVAASFCDPSMDINTQAGIRTIRDLYEDNGVPLECSINDRSAYSTAINNALATLSSEGVPSLQFLQPGSAAAAPALGCPYLIRTLPQMRYDVRSDNRVRMANHKDDHAVIALAYYLLSWASTFSEIPTAAASIPKWMKPKQKKIVPLGRESVSDRRPISS